MKHRDNLLQVNIILNLKMVNYIYYDNEVLKYWNRMSVLFWYLFSLTSNWNQPWTQGDLLNRPLIAKYDTVSLKIWMLINVYFLLITNINLFLEEQIGIKLQKLNVLFHNIQKIKKVLCRCRLILDNIFSMIMFGFH